MESLLLVILWILMSQLAHSIFPAFLFSTFFFRIILESDFKKKNDII